MPASTLENDVAEVLIDERTLQAKVAELEEDVVSRYPTLRDGLIGAGIDAGHRRLRMRLSRLDADIESGGVRLGFELGRGEYATSLLREIAALQRSSSRT